MQAPPRDQGPPLEADRIEVVTYDAGWPAMFAAERDLLASVLAADFLIEHVGSTAVPGLDAKPTVDLMVGATTLDDIERHIPVLEQLGYAYRADQEALIPERRFFIKPRTGPRRFHLHGVATDSAFWRDHLVFRDALRADADLAQRYAALKRALAARLGHDRNAYTDAKTDFIVEALRVASASVQRVLGADTCVNRQEEHAMSQPNRALAHRWMQEIWNERRTETVYELMAADAVGHIEDESGHRDISGPEPFIAFRNAFLAAFPDFRIDVEDVVTEGEKVVIRWMVRGTHTEHGLGMLPSRRRVSFRGITWMIVRDGKVVEGWDTWNQGGILSLLRTPLPA